MLLEAMDIKLATHKHYSSRKVSNNLKYLNLFITKTVWKTNYVFMY